MKNMHQHVEGSNNTFTHIPVIRLDSASVSIPVELVERVVFMKSRKHVVHIKISKSLLSALR